MRTTSSRTRALLAVLCLAACALPAREAFAQTALDMASARELYKQGKELRAAGDLKGAREKFKAAHATAATPITTLEYGRAEMDLGRLVEARELFLSIARMKVEPDETDKSAAARSEAAELAEKLKPRIPNVVVKLSGLPPEASAVVKIDGETIPAAAVGAPRAANPGPHEISAKAGEGKEVSQTIDLKESETKEVVLTPVWVAPPVARPVESTAPLSAGASRGTSPLVWVGVGVAVVGGAGGTITALMANAKANEIARLCNGTVCSPKDKDTVTSDQSSGKTLRGVSIGFFAFAAIGIGLTVTGFVVGGSEKKATAVRVEPWVSYDGAGVRGSF
jgi:hypothetical protein